MVKTCYKTCYNQPMKNICTKILILLFIFVAFNAKSFSKDVKFNDYSNANNWLSMPKSNYPVDIFYIYPTTCSAKDFSKSKNCDINDKGMRFHAKRVFKLQAEAFDTVGNIYAPYYTQLDARAFIGLDYKQIQNLIKSNKQEMTDIYNSLDYYFKNLNNGKPFILVSHSQGSCVMLFVLSDYMKKHPEHYKNMVAAYVIGYSVTKEYLKENPHLKFAKKSNDTGVIVSYNTQSPNKRGENFSYTKNQLTINPINWKRNGKYASKNQNLGSLDETTLKITTTGIADAKVDKKAGAVICSTVDEKKYEIPMPELFGHGSYHGQDFQFYYLNLRQNAKDRVEKFFRTKF